jgi:hypothetical protein
LGQLTLRAASMAAEKFFNFTKQETKRGQFCMELKMTLAASKRPSV